MNDGLAPLMLLGAAALFTALYTVLSLSSLKQLARICDESWNDVEHALRRRHELVPKLVETVRPLLSEHTELLDGTLRAIREAGERRAQAGERGLDESAVSVTLQRLLVLAEQRPALQQEPGFVALRRELADSEERIQSLRRTYNKLAKDLNRRRQSFPVNLLAGGAAAARRDAFELLPVGMFAGPAR